MSDEFDLDAVLAEEQKAPFTFTAFGRQWKLTHMGDIDVWPLLEAADLGDTAASKAVLEAAFGPDQYMEFRLQPLPQRAFDLLFTRYLAHCGVKSGESLASARSSAHTGKR